MKTILIAVLSLFCGTNLKAQDPSDFFKLVSGGFEFGASTVKRPILSGFLAYNKPKTYLKFKMSSVLQEVYELNVNGEEITRPGLSEIGFLVGKKIKINSENDFQIGIGTALVTDLKKYDASNSEIIQDKLIERNLAGLVAEIKYQYWIVEGIGLSLSLNGNLNQQRNFATAGFGFVFGFANP